LTAGPKLRTEVAKPTSRPYPKSYEIAQTCSFEDEWISPHAHRERTGSQSSRRRGTVRLLDSA